MQKYVHIWYSWMYVKRFFFQTKIEGRRNIFGRFLAIFCQCICTIGYKSRAPGAWDPRLQNMINSCTFIKILSHNGRREQGGYFFSVWEGCRYANRERDSKQYWHDQQFVTRSLWSWNWLCYIYILIRNCIVITHV